VERPRQIKEELMKKSKSAYPRSVRSPELCQQEPTTRLKHALAVCTLVAGGCAVPGAAAPLSVPADPQASCTVSVVEFNNWFETGSVTLNGVVKPADSVMFPNIPNCSFYRWTEQMFLWLTSPAPARYGSGGLVFQSPAFFDVSPLDGGVRTFIPHTPGNISHFAVRDSQVGPNRLPMILDKRGMPFEIEPTVMSESGRQLIRNLDGESVEIHRARVGKDRRPVFMDEKGQIIKSARPILREKIANQRVVQKFRFDQEVFLFLGPSGKVIDVDQGKPFEIEPTVMSKSGRQMIRNLDGESVEIHQATVGKDRRPVFMDEKGQVIKGARPILREKTANQRVVQKFRFKKKAFLFLGPAGNVIDVDQGQAGGGRVLMAQNGSLVYYLTSVNDVFAYLRTGAENGGIVPKPTQFPTTQTELNKIIAFATANGRTIIDPEALAIEVKTSWIEAAGLPNPSDFIKIRATIPTYDKSNPTLWVLNGEKTTSLAMVGMHVVGSTAGHPEMLWGTFEHVSNTPNSDYTYRNSLGNNTLVPQDTAGNWLFCQNNSAGPFNQWHMQVNGDDIAAIPGSSISPSDTIRRKAWGKAAINASSNAELISITNSVRDKLIAGDVRGNYVHTGTTWTIGGAAPNGGNEVGTNLMCNTTMETYDQGTNNGDNGMNCFTCHNSNTTSVSHMYPKLKPLF
jgi:hypothetical protein